jgi:hypothetical protein
MSATTAGSLPSWSLESAVWVLLPPPGTDSATWATGVAAELALRRGYADIPAAIEATELLMRDSATVEPLPGFARCLVFEPLPGEGAIVFSVAAVPATGDSTRDQRELLGVDSLGAFVGQCDDLRANGIEGFQLLRVDQEAVSEQSVDVSQERLIGTLTTVVRRNLRGVGEVDLIAAATSSEVLIVAAAVVPVVDLLLGDDMARLVGGDQV